MTKVLAPFILFAISIGLVFTYVKPAYEALQAFRAQESRLSEVIDEARDLQNRRDDLRRKQQEFSSTQLAQLNTLLPDTIDVIRLIIDVDSVASEHDIVITDFQVPQISTTVVPTPRGRQATTEASPVGSAVLQITASGEYPDFKAFIGTLESSLALLDVVNLSAEAYSGPVEDVPEDVNVDELEYRISIQTYWLRPVSIE